MKVLETGSAEHIETSTINLARDRVTLRNVPSVVVEIRSPHGLFPRFESGVESRRRRLLSAEDRTIPHGLAYTSRRSSSEV